MGNKKSDLKYPKCFDKRPCFARSERGNCKILEQTYKENGQCPFCKPYRDKDVNGNEYPPAMAAKIKYFEEERRKNAYAY